jgi:hypothetical protein
VAFPSDTKIIKMDEQKGTDYLLILFSTAKIDPASIVQDLSNARGGLSARIKAVLGNQLIDKANISYNPEKVGFSYESNSAGGIIPLMVELKHN